MGHSKQKVIETIYISGLEEIKVLYDIDKLTFKAKVFEGWEMAPLLADLRKMVSDKVKGVIAGKYKWIPVIEVKEQTQWGEDKVSCVVGFVAERFYVAKQENGVWLRCDWEIDTTRRSSACEVFKDRTFRVPSVRFEYHDESTHVYYIHYSEMKWEGLKRLSDAITELKVKLRELVGTEEGQKKLSAAGRLMLEWTTENDKADETKKERRDK